MLSRNWEILSMGSVCVLERGVGLDRMVNNIILVLVMTNISGIIFLYVVVLEATYIASG
jgi:hypothetical protein